MTIRSSGFTLVELMVVVAIIGILSATGIITYNGYIKATKKTGAENVMQQILLAQTEEYSNSGAYLTQGATCTPGPLTSTEIETRLFGGGDVISEENGYEMCIRDSGDLYIILAIGDTTMTLTANGIWTGK